MKAVSKRLDIYSELCPVSSATVIGAGLITMTVGSAGTGLFFVLAGIAVGVMGPVTNSIRHPKIRKRPRRA